MTSYCNTETKRSFLGGLKFLVFSLFLIPLSLSITTADAAQLFVTTIQGTNVEKAHAAILEVMTENKFIIDDVDKYKVVFTKNYGDGFFIASQHCMVKFNMLEQEDGSLKMMVSETEYHQNLGFRARSIDPLIPLIGTIRQKLDGTDPAYIENEAPTKEELANPKPVPLGLAFGDKTTDGFVAISSVEPKSKAAKVGLQTGDVIFEVDGRSVADMSVSALMKYIDGKMSDKSSVMLGYLRGDKRDLAVIRQ